ncbi:hypothetical protein TNIN_126021 [Trichonephila inaurata madagascariensis]|uniref:Uncharacterized protein n=1 Tax=Trichonephila inaurata madagascariensis TaxID=2747483 RepID=A0A8X6Y1A1_9ARAC|nr:hypothetical protein TNIN_126021 [Trichonephila inaurata madagascariensis]
MYLINIIRRKHQSLLGCLKDETEEIPMKEFCALRPKMYSYRLGKEYKITAKGTKKTVVQNILQHDMYVNVNSSKKSREILPAPGSPNPTWVMKVDSIDNNSGEPSKLGKSGCCFTSNGVTRIDLLCRILFPLTFAVFSVSYWAYYLELYNKE